MWWMRGGAGEALGEALRRRPKELERAVQAARRGSLKGGVSSNRVRSDSRGRMTGDHWDAKVIPILG